MIDIVRRFQKEVFSWCKSCFGDKTATDVAERNFRFIEESIELVQSLGATREDVLDMVEYVFSRPKGDPIQEVGGVAITLSVLCSANNIDLKKSAYIEFERISKTETMNKIREKHVSKTRRSDIPDDYIFSDYTNTKDS